MAKVTKAETAPAAKAPKAPRAKAVKAEAPKAPTAPKAVKQEKAAKAATRCLCNCGGEPKGKGRFLPGHDARLRGVVLRAVAVGIGDTESPGAVARSQAERTAMGFTGSKEAEARWQVALDWWSTSHPEDAKRLNLTATQAQTAAKNKHAA